MSTLNLDERRTVAQMNGDILRLLQLDESWTVAALSLSSTEPRERDRQRDELERVVSEMTQLLQGMGSYAELLGELAGRLRESEDDLDAIFWSDQLSDEDRHDLRWLVSRHGGSAGLAESAAEILSSYGQEVNLLNEQLERLRGGLLATGDLTRKFRCGLGQALLVGGILSVPATGVGAAAAAVTASGSALVAGVVVGATGGIAAIAVVVVGLFFMRKMKC